MKPINEVYSEHAETEAKGEYFYGPGDYGPLLDSFGYLELLRVDDRDYQGDSRVIYQSANRIGFLQFGWGSCSGCDALQACNSMKEIDDLRTSLHDSIKWFDSPAAALDYFEKHDWRGDYSWHEEEQRQFIEQAKELLRKMAGIIQP